MASLAVSGHMLDLGGSSIPSRTPVNIRLMLERVTLACNRSLARINMDAQHPIAFRLLAIRSIPPIGYREDSPSWNSMAWRNSRTPKK